MGLIRVLIWGGLLYIGYRIIKSLLASKKHTPPPSVSKAEDTVQDPVCKVFLSRDNAVVGTLDGQRHYFCSMDCLEKFREQLDNKKS